MDALKIDQTALRPYRLPEPPATGPPLVSRKHEDARSRFAG